MYDEFSTDYDRFVSWPGRLAYELPFLLEQARLAFQDLQPCRALDTACGTGMHAIALATFWRCLRPGGRLVLQSRNFDAVMAQRTRWMEPQSHREGDAEWLFVRFYDFEADGSIVFHILTLKRSEDKDWQQTLTSTRLLPLRQAELVAVLNETGFAEIECYGDLAGSPFVPEKSGNLVMSAIRQ